MRAGAQYSGAGCAARPDCVAGRRRQAGPEDCLPAFDRAANCCSLALAFSARRYRRAGARRSSTWPHAFHLTGTRAYGDCQDDTGKTFSWDPLEHSHYGHRGRYRRGQRTAHLARSRSEAAPRGNLQAEQRSPFRRETGGHRRPVSESARACARAVIGREEPDPSRTFLSFCCKRVQVMEGERFIISDKWEGTESVVEGFSPKNPDLPWRRPRCNIAKFVLV